MNARQKKKIVLSDLVKWQRVYTNQLMSLDRKREKIVKKLKEINKQILQTMDIATKKEES